MTALRRMSIFLQGRWPALGVSLALALATIGLGLLIPWLTRLTVDRVFIGGDQALLWPLALAIVGVAGLRGLTAFGRRIVSGRVALGVEVDMRNHLFAHMETLGLDYYMRSQTGQLLSRAIADVRAVRMFLGYGLIFMVTHAVTLVAVTVILFALDPSLAILCLLPMPLVLVTARRFSQRIHPSLYAIQQRVAELTAVAEERIGGIRVIKALAVEDIEQESFALASDRIYRQNLEAAGIRGRYVPLLGLLPNLSLIIILLYGGIQVTQGHLTLGGLVAFNGYVMMLVWPLRMLGMLLSWAQRAVASAQRVLEILDEQPSVSDRPGAADLMAVRGEVEFRSVSFGYGNGPSVDDVTLFITPGETVALVGPTGCGKTTLALLVPRFFDPQKGAVLLDGIDIRDVTRPSLRRHIGLVEQDPFLFSVSVRDNIRYGDPEASDERVVAAAAAAAAHDFIVALPHGYDTVIGERGVTLSGGQRQRLALARALLVEPQVLILDDATSSIDAETEADVLAALQSLRGRCTVIVIAHRPSTVKLADRVILMDSGRIRQQGAPADVPWEAILIADAEADLERQMTALAAGLDRMGGSTPDIGRSRPSAFPAEAGT